MYNGDFSGYKNASGAVIPIYDPATQCGTTGNANCPGGVAAASYSAGAARQPFPGNMIPASRINPVASKILQFPLVAQPNLAGARYTAVNNYAATCNVGGNNNQENGRVDDAATEKLRIFARYSRWNSLNQACTPFHNGIYANDPYSPETFTTTQAVVGATYLITPHIVLDIRASYVRFPYNRLESQENINLSQTFGFPAYMDQQLPIIHGGPGTGLPSFSISGYTTASGLHILSTENDYLLTPNLSWVNGKHIVKFGADWRNMQNTYYQTFDGGSFAFTNALTAQNGLNPGATGNGLASMLLGLGNSGSETAFSRPWESLHYQGYYVQDTWQATAKLTVTAGIRWEIPGVWSERYKRVASFNPQEVNSGRRRFCRHIAKSRERHDERTLPPVCSPSWDRLAPEREDGDPNRRGHLFPPVQHLLQQRAMGPNHQSIQYGMAGDARRRSHSRLSHQQSLSERLHSDSGQPFPRAGAGGPDWRLPGRNVAPKSSLSLSGAVEFYFAAPVTRWRCP
jgi:hypothetical protein